MTAWAKLDDRALQLPWRPSVSARAHGAVDVTATQASAPNLLAFANGQAQSTRGIETDDLLIAEVFHKVYLLDRRNGGELWLIHV